MKTSAPPPPRVRGWEVGQDEGHGLGTGPEGKSWKGAWPGARSEGRS